MEPAHAGLPGAMQLRVQGHPGNGTGLAIFSGIILFSSFKQYREVTRNLPHASLAKKK